MIKPETAADESIDLVKEKSVFFKECDNDVKPIKTENKSGSDLGQKDGNRNDENLDVLKSEIIDDNDDADSELSAVDDDDADDSGGEYMYNNGTDIITVRPINTENIVKTEQVMKTIALHLS